MAEQYTNAHIRSMVARRWRERDPRGVYFWASWLMLRWHVIPIVSGVVTASITFLVAGWVRG